jgi:uroporphyrinogen decarboxylase
MSTDRENMLRAARFERPDRIPMRYHINPACWHHYPQDALQDLMEAHPLLFPGFERSEGPIEPDVPLYARLGAPYVDDWCCTWVTADHGISGAVVEHPLADWAALERFQPPDPAHATGWGPIDWDEEARSIASARAEGRLASGGLRHGHTFLTLLNIRGYENLILDMADDDPRLWRLIEMVEAFNQGIVNRYVALGVEWMGYAEDLGMQVGPMVSPAHFCRYIQPTYRRLMAPALQAGCVVHMHSDGDIHALADDLVEGGVQVMNLQDLVNGLDWIEDRLKGRVCIDLDVDRQRITRYGTPAEIDALIREEVQRLGSPVGGLMMIYGLYPGTPRENATAVADAMERYASHYT